MYVCVCVCVCVCVRVYAWVCVYITLLILDRFEIYSKYLRRGKVKTIKFDHITFKFTFDNLGLIICKYTYIYIYIYIYICV